MPVRAAGSLASQADQDMKDSLEDEWQRDSGGDGSVSLTEFSDVMATVLLVIVLSEPC